MATTVRHFGSADPTVAFPVLERRSIAVNTANRQLAVGDEASGAPGVPLALLAVRYFDARAKYAGGDYVINPADGNMYRAKAVINPGAFNATLWDLVVARAEASYVMLDGSRAMTGPLTLPGSPTQPLQAATKGYTDSVFGNKVDRVGDTMSGDLIISADNARLRLNRTLAGGGPGVQGNFNGSARWLLQMGAGVESGGNSGSDLYFSSFNDSGVAIENPFMISRATGLAVIKGNPTAPLGIVPKQYVDALGLPVRYDAQQALTVSQQFQARVNIAAAPIDALAINGMQINGGMEVAQEWVGNTATIAATGGAAVACDQWTSSHIHAGGSALNVAQLKNATFPSLLSHSYWTAIGTGTGGVYAAGDYSILHQAIEYRRTQRLRWGTGYAQPVTISFALIANGTGDFIVSLRNGNYDGGRNYCVRCNYPAPANGTWVFYKITIPGDTAGTWVPNAGFSSNDVGMYLTFCFFSGGTNYGSEGAWGAGMGFGRPGMGNFYASSSAQLAVTGVTIIPGNEGPSTVAEMQRAMRVFDQEQDLAMRYWQKSHPYPIAPGSPPSGGAAFCAWTEVGGNPTSGVIGSTLSLWKPMRTMPTFTTYDGAGTAGKISYFNGAWVNGGTPSLVRGTEKTLIVHTNTASTTVVNYDFTANARM